MSLLRYFRLTARSRRAYAVYLVGAGGFSTSEQNTGVSWIDGSSIYQKVISFAAGPNNNTALVAHGITGLGTVVSLQAMLSDGTTRIQVSSSAAGTATNSIRLTMGGTNVAMSSTGNFAGYSGHVIVNYTKA